MPTLGELLGANAQTKDAVPATGSPPGSGAFGTPQAKPKDLSDSLAGQTLSEALKKLKVNVDPQAFMQSLQQSANGVFTASVGSQSLYLRDMSKGTALSPDTLMVIPAKEAQSIMKGQPSQSLLGETQIPAV